MRPTELANGDRATDRTRSIEPGVVVNGRYQLEAVIGRGGMGEVYRAVDLELGRTVALKVLHPRRATSEVALSRLRREARHMALLQHPNNVRLFEFVEVADGVAYLAMELVEGCPLCDLGLPLAPQRAVRLAADVCAALAEAHARGLIHRDLKPQNVMVTTVDDREFARVLDYGVATLLAAPSDLTRDGAFIGTALYAAPEQAEGARLGPAVDIYALGVMLFETLSGQRLFDGQTEASVLYQHAHATPPRLEHAVPDCDPALAQLVAQCLEKSPGRRPQSATQLRQSLLALADRLSPRPPARVVRLREQDSHSDTSISHLRANSVVIVATPAASTEAATVRSWTPIPRLRPTRRAELAAIALLTASMIAAGWYWRRVDADGESVPSGAATSAVTVPDPTTPPSASLGGAPPAPTTRNHTARWRQRLASQLGALVAASTADSARTHALTLSSAEREAIVARESRTRRDAGVDDANRRLDRPATTDEASPSRARLEGELRTLVDRLPDEVPPETSASDRVRDELDLLGPIE